MYIRCQMGGYGGIANGRASGTKKEGRTQRRRVWRTKTDPQPGRRTPGEYTIRVYCCRCENVRHVRSTIGFEPQLLHDVHERLAPIDAVRLAKALEPYRLFFLEDPLAPEDQRVVPDPAQHSRRRPSRWASCSPTRWSGRR